MITDLLRQQLTACILDSLREQAYAPPSTLDNTVRDAFFTEAASIVLARIRAEGWTMEIPKTLFRDTDHPAASEPSDMTLAMIEEDLRFSICLGLKLYRLKPRRSRNPAQREQWLGWVAEAVVERILMSNWALTPVLQKLAPTRRHSTSDFMGKAG
jgi:hypothetical protein